MPTDRWYTGQRWEAGVGLYDYGARFYDPALGRFLSPDTIVPQPGNPQSLNRFSYVLNNPLRYVDPSGHAECVDEGCHLVFHPVSGDVIVRDVGSSALYAFIRRASVGRATAAVCMKQVLPGTAGTGQIPVGFVDRWAGQVTRTHFGGLGALKGDEGFAPEFQDDHLYREIWGYTAPESKQLGHFLTAVDMGMHGGWQRSIVGHEQYRDSPPGLFIQVLVKPEGSDLEAFASALLLDEQDQYQARDIALQSILNPTEHGPLADRKGNSLEDLRLSIRGYRLGQMLASGHSDLKTNRDLANWIALFVAGD